VGCGLSKAHHLSGVLVSHRNARTTFHGRLLMVRRRRRHRCGPEEIGAKLGVHARTVSRVLNRHGIARLCDCDPMTGQVICASKAAAVRYERGSAGRTSAYGC
jgi:leucine-zipper of insertion element IS481